LQGEVRPLGSSFGRIGLGGEFAADEGGNPPHLSKDLGFLLLQGEVIMSHESIV
jgi:hypothetical protein